MAQTKRLVIGLKVLALSLALTSSWALEARINVNKKPPLQIVASPTLPIELSPVPSAFGNYTLKNNLTAGRNFIATVSLAHNSVNYGSVQVVTVPTNISNPCAYNTATNEFYIPGKGATCAIQIEITGMENTTTPASGELSINYFDISNLTTKFTFTVPEGTGPLQSFLPAQGPDSGAITCIAEGLRQEKGRNVTLAAVTTDTAGVFGSTDGAQTWFEMTYNLPTRETNCATAYADGTLLVGHALGASVLAPDTESWKAMKVPAGYAITATAVDDTGIAYLGYLQQESAKLAATGILRCPSVSGSCVDTGLRGSGEIYALVTDDNGNLWVGAEKDAYLYAQAQWTALDSPIAPLYGIGIDSRFHIVYGAGLPSSDLLGGVVGGVVMYNINDASWQDAGFPANTPAYSLGVDEESRKLYVGGGAGDAYHANLHLTSTEQDMPLNLSFTKIQLASAVQVQAMYPGQALLYAGTAGNGAFTSADHGESYTRASSGITASRTFALLTSLNNGNIVTGQAAGMAGQYDKSDTVWGSSYLGIPSDIVALSQAPDNGFKHNGLTYPTFAATDGSAVFSSPDDGVTWTQQPTSGLDDPHLATIAIDTTNAAYTGGPNLSGAFKLASAGTEWEALDENFTSKVTTIFDTNALNTEDEILLIGTGNGIYAYNVASPVGVGSFGTGLAGHTITYMAYAGFSNTYYAGTQEHGLVVYDSTFDTWNQVAFAGQTINSLIYDFENRVLYIATPTGVWYTADGTDFFSFNFGLDDAAEVQSLTVSTGKVYAGTDGTAVYIAPAITTGDGK